MTAHYVERYSPVVGYSVLGGILGVLLTPIPLAPILGGVLAGYGSGGSDRVGVAAGIVAGNVMLLPPTAVALGYAVVVTFREFRPGGDLEGLIVALLLVLVALVVATVYYLALAVAGGVLGARLSARRR